MRRPVIFGGTAVATATATALSTQPGVGRVDAVTGRYLDGQLLIGPDPSLDGVRKGDAVRFNLVPTVAPVSPDGEALVKAIRSADLPIKAIVLNLLSLSATFGAMVWVFHEGRLAGWLGVTPTGLTDTTTPILMLCIAFGLSMDYEVFLLSRIKEEHDRSGDNTAAVAARLEKAGRIVTAAASLLAVTFVATGTSDITFIKLFGLGLALAVVMDATLVRGILVPSFMRLAGEANWWAPPWMRRIHDRFGFSEHVPDIEVPDSPAGLDELEERESVRRWPLGPRRLADAWRRGRSVVGWPPLPGSSGGLRRSGLRGGQ